MRWVIPILILVLLSSVAIACEPKEGFLERLQDNCTIANNEICEDGEDPINNPDCEITLSSINCNGRCIFSEIWFAKLLLVLVIAMLFFFKGDYKVIIFLAIFILVINFTGFDLFGESKVIEPTKNTTVTITPEDMNDNILMNYGSKVMPSNPMMGAVGLIALVFFIVRYITKKMGGQWTGKRRRY